MMIALLKQSNTTWRCLKKFRTKKEKKNFPWKYREREFRKLKLHSNNDKQYKWPLGIA